MSKSRAGHGLLPLGCCSFQGARFAALQEHREPKETYREAIAVDLFGALLLFRSSRRLFSQFSVGCERVGLSRPVAYHQSEAGWGNDLPRHQSCGAGVARALLWNLEWRSL